MLLRFTIAVLLLLAPATSHDTAEACGLAQAPMPGDVPPLQDSTQGPMPTLYSIEPLEPELVQGDGQGSAIPIVRMEEIPTFRADGGAQTTAWRPAEPLRAGVYVWRGRGGNERFFVDEANHPEPFVVGKIELALRLHTPEQDTTFGDCGSSDSCSDVDFTGMTVTLQVPAEAPERLVLTLSKGTTSQSQLVRAVPNDSTQPRTLAIGISDRFLGMPSFKSGRFCVALTPMDEDGALGEMVEGGCISPDPDDPRVTDDRACVGGGAIDLGWLAIAFSFLARARFKRGSKSST